jgi:uncharacterized protein (DUF58 family)
VLLGEGAVLDERGLPRRAGRSMSEVFNYEIAWPAVAVRPGHHRSLRGGGGFEFREHRPLRVDPDPRRLDLLQTLRDPFGEFKVRAFRERRAIAVHILADVSMSMHFGSKFDLVREFTVSAAHSAYRTGDPFGFMGAAGTLLEDLCFPCGRSKNLAALIEERLRRLAPSGRSSRGMGLAASRVGRRRALVFLLSDFHCELEEIGAWLDRLAAHAVVPVVIWDRAEYTWPERLAWTRVRDLESGQQRGMLLRPGLSAKIRAGFVRRQRELRACFLKYGARPLGVTGRFDADRVSHYFAHGDGWPDLAGPDVAGD